MFRSVFKILVFALILNLWIPPVNASDNQTAGARTKWSSALTVFVTGAVVLAGAISAQLQKQLQMSLDYAKNFVMVIREMAPIITIFDKTFFGWGYGYKERSSNSLAKSIRGPLWIITHVKEPVLDKAFLAAAALCIKPLGVFEREIYEALRSSGTGDRLGFIGSSGYGGQFSGGVDINQTTTALTEKREVN